MMTYDQFGDKVYKDFVSLNGEIYFDKISMLDANQAWMDAYYEEVKNSKEKAKQVAEFLAVQTLATSYKNKYEQCLSLQFKAKKMTLKQHALMTTGLVAFILLVIFAFFAGVNSKKVEEIKGRHYAVLRKVIEIDPDCQFAYDKAMEDGKITGWEADEILELHDKNLKVSEKFVNSLEGQK